MNRPITIIGGGLAGLTLGIALRQRGVCVHIHEALSYPRNRVCGEFICGRGLESLQRLGLLRLMQEAGGRPAQRYALYMGAMAIPPQDIPAYHPKGESALQNLKALCISRWTLDAMLAAEFERLGGIMRHERCPRFARDRTPEGVVDATGRKMPPNDSPKDGKWRWVGIKAHACNVPLAADLELHLLPDGYVGLCQLMQDEVNVCALFRHRAPLHHLGETWRRKLAELHFLRERLGKAQWIEDSFCAVAGLDFRTMDEPCRVGDALGMLPPFTGNGMSAAFESAEVASEPLATYAKGVLSWEEACCAIHRAYHGRFGRRYRWARLIHPVLFHPAIRGAFFRLVRRSPLLAAGIFRMTR